MKVDNFLTVGQVTPSTYELLWGDLWEDVTLTFIVNDMMKQPIITIPHSQSNKEVIYYVPEVFLIKVTGAEWLDETKAKIHLPQKAIGYALVNALRAKGLQEKRAKVTIYKKSYKKARVESVEEEKQTYLGEL